MHAKKIVKIIRTKQSVVIKSLFLNIPYLLRN